MTKHHIASSAISTSRTHDRWPLPRQDVEAIDVALHIASERLGESLSDGGDTVPFSVKTLLRSSHEKLLHRAIRRRCRGRELQGDLIDRRSKRLDQIVGKSERIASASVEDSECRRQPRVKSCGVV